MNAREERGTIIAAFCKLNRKDDNEWIVPSQSKGETIYHVNPSKQTCSCPDHADPVIRGILDIHGNVS